MQSAQGRDSMFNNNDWLGQLNEDVIDPEREIVDPHHHLWPQPSMAYNIFRIVSTALRPSFLTTLV